MASNSTQKFALIAILFFFNQISYSQNRSFINSGFETPLTVSTTYYTDGYAQNSVSPIPNVAEWFTTAPDKEIEVWHSGYNGVPAAKGIQFVELNANYVSRLYQFICLRNGETMNWSFYHRGRLGSDTMEFNIYNQSGTTKLATIIRAIDGTSGWGYYSGIYTTTLPSGIYQFSAESIGAASGNQTNGNFLDEIKIGLEPLVEFASSTSSGLVTLGNNIPQLEINGTVPTGGSIVTLSIVGTGTTAINGIDFLLTTTVNIPAGEYNPTSPYITIPLTILNTGKVGPNTNIQIAIVGATNTMVVGDDNCSGITNNNSTYTIINTNCSAGHILNNYAWYKADVGVSGTNTVSSWSDVSGNGFNLGNGVAGSAPTFLATGINFNPSIYFNGTSNYLTRSSLFGSASAGNLYTYIVARTDQVKSQYLFWETTTGSNSSFDSRIPYSDGNAYYDVGIPANGRATTLWGSSTGQYILWSLNSTTTTSSPSGTKQAIYRNGLKLSSVSTGSNPILTGNNSPFSVGRNESTASDYFAGAIAEISIFNSPLTAANQAQIQSYFAVKYGIGLDQSTPQHYYASNGSIIFNATSNSGFLNNIAGIGRDDYSCLNQKQSQSSNGDIVAIGLGTIGGSNAANPNSFVSDVNYFIWGNNNGANNSTGALDVGTTINAVAIQTRLNDVWKGQETGPVGSLQLTFSLASVPGLQGLGNNDMSYLRLLVDPNGVFATGATAISPANYNNTNKTVTFNWDFTSLTGFYFTLGSVNVGLAPLPLNMIVFTALAKNETVQLDWKVAQENNYSLFNIQKSANGNTWYPLTTVASFRGDNEYEAVDILPLPGANYYRLTAMSPNGITDELGVRLVNVENIGNISWDIYPNPNSGSFQISWNKSNEIKNLNLNIYNSLGQIILTTQLTDPLTKINLTNIKPGTYEAEIETDNYKSVKSFVVIE